MRTYSDPTKANDPYYLPDIEVFYLTEKQAYELAEIEGEDPGGAGWYWWTCLPGCLPDSEAQGPYGSQQLAVDAAQAID